MARSKPIPVKLSDELIARLDAVSASTGLNNRSALIKFCISTFLEHVERSGLKGLPAEWEEILRDLDGRSHRYAKLKMVAEEREPYGPARKRGRPKKNGESNT